jgi:hypothetical protein
MEGDTMLMKTTVRLQGNSIRTGAKIRLAYHLPNDEVCNSKSAPLSGTDINESVKWIA